MNSLLLNVYNRSPQFARDTFASLNGFKLRRWRYGGEFRNQVSRISGRDLWSREEFDAFIAIQLRKVLENAASQIPYYRDLLVKHPAKLDGEHAFDLLRDLPTLRKSTLRNSWPAFLRPGVRTRSMYHEYTSGTTGTPLHLWQSRRMCQTVYAYVEARIRNWAGVSWGERWAMLGGQVVVPFEQRKPPFWVRNIGLNQLYMSSHHLSAEFAPHFHRALKEFRPVYIWGYASSLFALAQFSQELGIDPYQPEAIFSNAEPLYDFQKSVIQEAFGCRVYNTYGSAEAVAFASECEYGSLHLSPEFGYVEVMDGDRRVPDGQAGELVCTSLLNFSMPLIRYRTGDMGAISHEPCQCSREMPLLKSLHGRWDDVLITRDGRRIGRLDPVFKGDLHIREAQIIQEAYDIVRLRIVPAKGFSVEDERLICRGLVQRIGDMHVEVEQVRFIERNASGKFRAVVSNITRDSSQENA